MKRFSFVKKKFEKNTSLVYHNMKIYSEISTSFSFFLISQQGEAILPIDFTILGVFFFFCYMCVFFSTLYFFLSEIAFSWD